MAKLPITLSQLRAIEWGTNYLWAVRFPEAPEPFKSFFPAVTMDEHLGSLNNDRISFYDSEFVMPKGRGALTLQMTLMDDASHTLEFWLQDWIASIHNRSEIKGQGTSLGYVSTLMEAAKNVDVLKANRQMDIVASTTYTVIPSGNLMYMGAREASLCEFQVTFDVVGQTKRNMQETGELTASLRYGVPGMDLFNESPAPVKSVPKPETPAAPVDPFSPLEIPFRFPTE